MEKKIDWLKKYADQNKELFFEITDVKLCNSWEDAFGLNKRALGRFLSKAYKQGLLDRGRIGISCGYWNNPKWVYSYSFRQK